MSRLLIMLAVLLTSTAAFADGTVRGRVTILDRREDPYTDAGYAQTPPGARQLNRFNTRTVGAPEMLVEVCVRLGALCVPIWTRTDANGSYAVRYQGLTSPLAIEVRAYPIRPQLNTGATTVSLLRPPHELRVTTAGISDIIVGEVRRTILLNGDLSGTQTINMSLGGNAAEVLHTYLSAHETYAMLDTQEMPRIGTSIRADMQGLDIFANEVNIGTPESGVAPLFNQVLLTPLTGTSTPFVIPHEIGHIVAWRAMDWITAPYGLAVYSYNWDASMSWNMDTNEYEKAAFWEGFASVVEALWMWNTNAVGPRLVGWGLEQAAPQCGAGVDGHRRAICVTRAFWDIVDDPPGDDDGLTWRDLGEVVTTFRSYSGFHDG
jgi:hypothetical protein